MAAIGFAVFVGMAAGLYAGSPRYEIKPSGSYSERIGHRAVHKQK